MAKKIEQNENNQARSDGYNSVPARPLNKKGMSRICWNCGKPVVDGIRFCPDCGQKLNQGEENNVSIDSSENTNVQPGTKENNQARSDGYLSTMRVDRDKKGEKLLSLVKLMKSIPLSLILASITCGLAGCGYTATNETESEMAREIADKYFSSEMGFVNQEETPDKLVVTSDLEELREMLGIEQPTVEECWEAIENNANLTDEEKENVLYVLNGLEEKYEGNEDLTRAYLNLTQRGGIKFEYNASRSYYDSTDNTICLANHKNDDAYEGIILKDAGYTESELEEEISHALRDSCVVYMPEKEGVIICSTTAEYNQDEKKYVGFGLAEGFTQLTINMDNDEGQLIIDKGYFDRWDSSATVKSEKDSNVREEDVAYVLDYILPDYDASDFGNTGITGLRQAMNDYGFTNEEINEIIDLSDEMRNKNCNNRTEIFNIIFQRYAEKKLAQNENPCDIWYEICSIINSSWMGQRGNMTRGVDDRSTDLYIRYGQEELKENVRKQIEELFSKKDISLTSHQWNLANNFSQASLNQYGECWRGFKGKNGKVYVIDQDYDKFIHAADDAVVLYDIAGGAEGIEDGKVCDEIRNDSQGLYNKYRSQHPIEQSEQQSEGDFEK